MTLHKISRQPVTPPSPLAKTKEEKPRLVDVPAEVVSTEIFNYLSFRDITKISAANKDLHETYRDYCKQNKCYTLDLDKFNDVNTLITFFRDIKDVKHLTIKGEVSSKYSLLIDALNKLEGHVKFDSLCKKNNIKAEVDLPVGGGVLDPFWGSHLISLLMSP